MHYRWVSVQLVFQEVAVLKSIDAVPIHQIKATQPFRHKSVSGQSLSLLMFSFFFVQNALHFKRQHISTVRSSSLILHSKHKAAKCNIEQAFSIPIWKKIRGTCISFFELTFQTVPSRHYLTTGGAVVREKLDCLLRDVSSPTQLGHLGLSLC